MSGDSNFKLNGHTLYVNGTAITSTNYKGATVITNDSNDTANSENEIQENSSIKNNIIISIAIVIVFLGAVLIVKKIINKH